MSLTTIAIGDLGRIVTGKTPNTSKSGYFEGDYPFVTPSDLDWKTYRCNSTERSVTEAAKKSLKNQFIPDGSILVTCIGNTIGKCGIATSECLTNQQVNSIVPADRTLSKFIYYLLVHNTDCIRSVGLGGGAATPILNKTTFSNIRLKVPDVRHWKRIGSFLASYDDLIENNRRRIKLLEQSARLLYKEWFVHLRFPGHEHVKIKDGVPEGWERHTLTELAEDVSYGFTASSTREELGPKFLRITDIVPDVIDWETVPFCVATDEDLKRNRLEIGDVVVARTGATVGFAKRITSLPAAAVYASYLVRFRFGTFSLSSIAGTFMESDAYKEHVRNHAGGAAQPNANAKVLGSAPILVPPQTIQDQFSNYAEHFFRQRDILMRQTSFLAKARDFLLPRLMSGELAA